MFEEDAHYTRARAKRIAKKIAAYTVLVLISIIWLIPFVYLFVQSFGVAYDQTRFIPAKITMSYYLLIKHTHSGNGGQIHLLLLWPLLSFKR